MLTVSVVLGQCWEQFCVHSVSKCIPFCRCCGVSCFIYSVLFHIPYIIQVTNKQLEEERKYLEDELKQRGRGKHPSARNQQSSNPLRTMAVCTENVSTEFNAEPAKLTLPSRARKEINILEDLDKENLFNPSELGKDHSFPLERNVVQPTGCGDQTVSEEEGGGGGERNSRFPQDEVKSVEYF